MADLLLGIIIGTGILWLLTAIAVHPLADYLLKRRLEEPDLSYLNSDELDERDQVKRRSIANRCFILADVLVLGTAGRIMGLALGWFFVGIAFDKNGWPGMLVFVIASIFGAMTHGM